MATGGRAEQTSRRRAEVKLRLQLSLLELVEEQSFREIKVESVAEAAGLSRSAFYFYYADKQELLIDAAREAAGQLLEQADRWWHGDGDPVQLIRDGLGGIAEVWSEHAGVMRTTVEVATYSEEIGEFWNALVERFVAGTSERVRLEQQRGTIDRALDADACARILIWGAERGLYQLVSANRMARDDWVETTTLIWARALYLEGSR